ncbi:hypothetical protein DE146DRAFT_440249 [Phaeosphaeria sp. MPI-PUGE-AT-0046c]|nr:hypothetical protein DE146DRAFT_440249 [Phaeosphaeria sp. MPI-PUGE-AT-0046c]
MPQAQAHVAITDGSNDLDDIRYEHHLRHRGQSNHSLFWIFWWSLTAFVMLKLAYRSFRWCRRRVHRTHRYVRLTQASTYGRFEHTRAFLRVVKAQPIPPIFGFTITTYPVSRIVALALYSSMTLYLLTLVDAPILSDHFVDDVAFRAAWVTITQIPLVYMLSAKYGPIKLLTSMSHERINWAHRWVGRVLLLSATLHVAIMKSSISMEDILHSHDKGMSVVRYGIATYAVLVWIAITSIIPLRRWSYKAFYINHYISTIIFLIIVCQHLPSYAQIPIYLATAIVAIDKFTTAYFFVRNNISITNPSRKFIRSRSTRRVVVGFPVRMTTPPPSVSCLPTQTTDTTTIVRITNIPFTWKPGQHIRLSVPSLELFSTHPFTPANCSAMPPPPLPPRKDIEQNIITGTQPRQTSEMLLLIKQKEGFTRRLADYHRDWLARPCPNASAPSQQALTAYIDGPYGDVPEWSDYAQLVLVSTSTGVSFALSIIDYLEQMCFTSHPIATQSVVFVWTTRHVDPVLEESVLQLVARCAGTLRDCGIIVRVEMGTTCLDAREVQDPSAVAKVFDPFAHLRGPARRCRKGLRIRHPDEIYEEWEREAEMVIDDGADPFLTYGDEDEMFADADEEESSGSEAGTLVDGDEQEEVEASDEETVDGEDPFSHRYAETERDEAYRPLPPSPEQGTRNVEEPSCQCAIIQHQRRKLVREKPVPGITRHYGARLDVKSMMGQVAGADTMIAVCANQNIVRDLRKVVAKANMNVARGERKGRCELFVENQA